MREKEEGLKQQSDSFRFAFWKFARILLRVISHRFRMYTLTVNLQG